MNDSRASTDRDRGILRRWQAMAAIVALASLTVACSVPPAGGGTGSSASASAAPSENASSDPSATPEGGRLSAADAIDSALAAQPQGAVVDMGLDRIGLTLVWDVDVLLPSGAGTSVYIGASHGEVVAQRPIVLLPPQNSVPAVTASTAVDTALADTPGSIVEIGLGTARGRVVWEALIASRSQGLWEVYIDATTGEVVKSESGS